MIYEDTGEKNKFDFPNNDMPLSGLADSYKNATYQEKLKLQSLIFTEKPAFNFSINQTPKISLILQNKRELASANYPIVASRGVEPLFLG